MKQIFWIPIDLCISKRPMSVLWMHEKSELRLQGHRACRRGQWESLVDKAFRWHDDDAYAISCYVTFTPCNLINTLWHVYRLFHDPCSGRMCLHRWTMQSSWICHTQKAGAKKVFFISYRVRVSFPRLFGSSTKRCSEEDLACSWPNEPAKRHFSTLWVWEHSWILVCRFGLLEDWQLTGLGSI